MSKPVSFEQLQKLTGYEKPADVTAFLVRCGIQYFPAKYGRPITTTGLMEQAAIQASGRSSDTTSSTNQSQTIDV